MLDRDLMRKAAEEAIRVFAERDPELRDALDMTCGMVADPSAVLSLLDSERRLREALEAIIDARQYGKQGDGPVYWIPFNSDLWRDAEAALADPPAATEGGAGC